MTNKVQQESDEVLILKRELDNMRRSRDYFRTERDDLKRHHEEIMSTTMIRVSEVERKTANTESALNGLLKEAEFLKDELELAERNVMTFKTIAWFLGLTCVAFFCLVIYASSH